MPSQHFFTHGHALLIGVGDPPVTAKDASGLYDILVDRERCAYPQDQVRLRTAGQATRGEIVEGLKWLRTCAEHDRDATAIVYFSGHGILTPTSYLKPHEFDIDN